MVVRHLRRVEYALRLLQRLATDGFDQLSIRRYASKLRLVQSIQRLRTLRVDVVTQILCIHTWIGGEFSLVERLYQVQRHLS